MNITSTFFLGVASMMLFSIECFAQEKMVSETAMPIIAWYGIPEAETTLERFKELKESGININYSPYSSIAAVEKALNIAKQAGIKLLPYCPELKSDPEKTVKRLMNHPALSGYHVIDEPGATQFAELGSWVKKIQAIDKKHYCYINLLPNYASDEQLFSKDYESKPGTDVYTEHVEAFLKEVPVPFISFDHYPLIEKDGERMLRPLWYKNLEIVAAASQKHQLPFWAFALTAAHKPYPVPTTAEIRLQVYSNLAYGAQTLQYFTYWTPSVNPNWDFHEAPIGLDGKRTAAYDRIKLLNQEIQNLAGVFLGATLISVAHTGIQIPAGTKRLDKLPEHVQVLETSDNGAIVSLLRKGENRFLVIVNRDFKNSMKLTLAGDAAVKRILKDGSIVPASAYTNTLAIDAGDAVIYMWKNQ